MSEALEIMLDGCPPVVSCSPVAAVARVLAGMLDDPDVNATARVGAAREFREVLVRLLDDVPAGDRMTEFEERMVGRL